MIAVRVFMVIQRVDNVNNVLQDVPFVMPNNAQIVTQATSQITEPAKVVMPTVTLVPMESVTDVKLD